MSTLKTPGVYVEQTPTAPGPIQGASTSVAAFVGLTIGGPAPETVHAISDYREFVELFAVDNRLPVYDIGLNLLANGVYGFFDNGGTYCYVTRASCLSKEKETAEAWATSCYGSIPEWFEFLEQFAVRAVQKVLAAVSGLDPKLGSIADGKAMEKLGKSLEDKLKAAIKERFDANHADEFNVNAVKKIVSKALSELKEKLGKPGDTAPDLKSDLMALFSELSSIFAQEIMQKSDELKQQYRDKSIKSLNNVDNETEFSIAKALAALNPYEDISIVAAPGLTGEDHWTSLIKHCTKSAPNCFAVLDSPLGSDWANNGPIYPENALPEDPNYAAVYYPWITVKDVVSGGEIAMPPSGHVAGIYARVDAAQGVFKAPANEAVYGALELEARVSGEQQEMLNDGYLEQKNGNGPHGININCIRYLSGNILVWGARTLQPNDDGQFRYVSNRRTFNYIRQSLEEGVQWAVFEPNTPALWGQIIRNVSSFLTKLWQSGGLFGATAAEAFFVKCDAETNPESVRNDGEVVTEVGVALTKPAEFVVFKLGLTTNSATASTTG